MNVVSSTLSVVFVALLFHVSTAVAQFDFESEPINYNTAPVKDRVQQLRQQLISGETKLDWDETQGWLPSLLKNLGLSKDTQTLVFTKTSLQLQQINPRNPRALFFNDDVYLGYVPGGKIIELSAVDPNLGAIFYSIKQSPDAAEILRDQSECMTCHATSKTKNVPGYLVRSVFPAASGHPQYSLGTTTTSHTTPFSKRFGGWYVTGSHGAMRHRGNSIASKDVISPIDVEQGANQTELPAKINKKLYAADSSDIVALMVLEHQTQMHNLITQAAYEFRRATFYDQTMNRVLDRPDGYVSESTGRRINSVADQLLEYLLFSEETRLTSPVKGTTDFETRFSRLGPRDTKGRSLREFDLKTRMFKYPCSFLIYSDSFSSLPIPILDQLESRLARVLLGLDTEKQFSHLSEEDRVAIREILADTKPGFAERIEQAKHETALAK